ncbi:MAG: RING finger family 4 domain-containing protein, partial [Polyangiales bacterium]
MASSVRELLLTRTGRVYVDSLDPAEHDDLARAIELELAALGYVVSTRLHARLARATRDELVSLRAWMLEALLAHVGGNQKHEPLFRSFPEGIPTNTAELWWQRVLVHFLQAEGQPCLFCTKSGTTHVLDPCRHVVCDQCFDGSNYSGCPVCGRKVDRGSPFF